MDKVSEVKAKKIMAQHAIRNYCRRKGVSDSSLVKESQDIMKILENAWEDPVWGKALLGGMIGGGFGVANRVIDPEFSGSTDDFLAVLKDAGLYGGVGAGVLGGIGGIEEYLGVNKKPAEKL